MSQPKKNDTEIFSIDGGEWSNNIPGVTQLLRANGEKQKALQPKNSSTPENASSPTTPSSSGSKNSFQSFGISFEHHFKLKENKFVYSHSVSHQGELKDWQKNTLYKLEFDPRTIPLTGVFTEIPKSNAVMQEIFACGTTAFLQLVRSGNENFIVTQSSQSLILKKDEVIAVLFPDSAAAPIEIDLAS